MNVHGIHGKHNHIHGVSRSLLTITDGQSIGELIGKDALLVRDHSAERAQFQGRFRKTSFGDFKHRPGFGPEIVEAQIEDHEHEDAKAVEANATAEIVKAAADAGVIVETKLTQDEERETRELMADYERWYVTEAQRNE